MLRLIGRDGTERPGGRHVNRFFHGHRGHGHRHAVLGLLARVHVHRYRHEISRDHAGSRCRHHARLHLVHFLGMRQRGGHHHDRRWRLLLHHTTGVMVVRMVRMVQPVHGPEQGTTAAAVGVDVVGRRWRGRRLQERSRRSPAHYGAVQGHGTSAAAAAIHVPHQRPVQRRRVQVLATCAGRRPLTTRSLLVLLAGLVVSDGWRRWRRWRWRWRTADQLTRPAGPRAAHRAVPAAVQVFPVGGYVFGAAHPHLVVLVAVALGQIVHRIGGGRRLQHGDAVGMSAVQGHGAAGRHHAAAVGHAPPSLHLLDGVVARHHGRRRRPVRGAHRAVYAVGRRAAAVTDAAAAVRLFGVRRVGVRVETAPDQRVGGHLAFAYERVTLQHLDAGRAAQYGREQRRMVGVRGPGERRVQRQEPRLRRAAGLLGHQHEPDGRAVVQRLDREESGDLLVVLVHVLQQQTVAPHAQPRVDAPGPQRPLFRVQLLERFLYALQPVLGDVRHRGAQVQHPAPADGRRVGRSSHHHHRAHRARRQFRLMGTAASRTRARPRSSSWKTTTYNHVIRS